MKKYTSFIFFVLLNSNYTFHLCVGTDTSIIVVGDGYRRDTKCPPYNNCSVTEHVTAIHETGKDREPYHKITNTENHNERGDLIPSSFSLFVLDLTRILVTFRSLAPYYLPPPSPMLSETLESHTNATYSYSYVSIGGAMNHRKLSEACQRDVDAIYNAFHSIISLSPNDIEEIAAIWPLRILDSWSKYEGGISIGNSKHLGFMELCTGIDTSKTRRKVSSWPDDLEQDFTGQYCYVQTHSLVDISNRTFIPSVYGTCVPSSCSTQELQEGIDASLSDLDSGVSFMYCQKKGPLAFGTWEIIASAIIGAIAIPVLFSSIAEYFFNCPKPLVKVFSAVGNLNKIMTIKTDAAGDINCLHGMRVLSIAWIILGHQVAYIPSIISNGFEYAEASDEWSVQLLTGGYRAVDTFMLIGGFLLTKALLSRSFCIRGVKSQGASSNVTSKKRQLSGHINVMMQTEDNLNVTDADSSQKNSPSDLSSSSCNMSIKSIELGQDLDDHPFVDMKVWREIKAQGWITSLGTFSKNYMQYIFIRFVRLWPAVLVVSLICAGWASVMVDGPLKGVYERSYLKTCRENFWVDLTFASNLVFRILGQRAGEENNFGGGGSCIPHSWYLGVDFQLYLVFPFFILPMKLFKYKLQYLLFMIVVSCLIPGFIILANDLIFTFLLISDTAAQNNFAQKVYMMPFTRSSPYFVGALYALVFHKVKEEKDSKWTEFIKLKFVQAAGWFMSTALALASLFSLVGFNTFLNINKMDGVSDVWSFLYGGFIYAVWSLAVGWIILMCSLGYGGPVNGFLSHGLWQPFSRLTFCVYLISLPLQLIMLHSHYAYVYLDLHYLMSSACSITALSFIAAFFISLIAEAPYINMVKLMLKRG